MRTQTPYITSRNAAAPSHGPSSNRMLDRARNETPATHKALARTSTDCAFGFASTLFTPSCPVPHHQPPQHTAPQLHASENSDMALTMTRRRGAILLPNWYVPRGNTRSRGEEVKRECTDTCRARREGELRPASSVREHRESVATTYPLARCRSCRCPVHDSVLATEMAA
ncbi:hypothetical protein OH76DRAFT_1240894 [Lentinus brumalis]|uniref:Uncharacterized protein n=1 Tax=Lentinus brumalis TaxID=2498619 RepID=A0A371CS56_9APHY|nr:hypothetical protein OH76DRAFT_1240894 [Polyporus brumalis]